MGPCGAYSLPTGAASSGRPHRARVRARTQSFGGQSLISATNVRIPEEAKERLAHTAAAEGLSLRAYLARLADTLLTPAERAEQAWAALEEWTRYTPDADQEQDLERELYRCMAQAAAR
ncbi:hypothetical protein [Streptomyces fractus]|uniref:hypothetical protein n=1 Tax=Streptomyces fractus TaxID=641806 RepID=UPI003CF17C41